MADTDPDGTAPSPRRALIMAGGGVKVAFQAGVLQVWLDEAGIDFHLADGASGGVFNLAMWCQGMSGTQIADNWRRYNPWAGFEPALSEWLRLPVARSLFRLERLRRNVLERDWGLDFAQVRATEREATFNLYNFSQHRLEVRTADEIDEDLLVSAVSLPMWFPPVERDGEVYIDAVYATDANLEEAIRRGADELWVIWTVSRSGRWRAGLLHHYFQIIEAAANSSLHAILDRVETNNDALARGDHGEFGRRVEVKMLEAEVPLHYLLNFSRGRFRTAVEQGVEAGRAWCRERGIALDPPRPPPPTSELLPRRVSFTEVMEGPAAFGTSDPGRGAARGRQAGSGLGFELTIVVDDIDRFVVDPDNTATASGVVFGEVPAGRQRVERGVFNLFVDQESPRDKRMLYRLWFRDHAGHPLTLVGYKIVRDDPGFDLWTDTTTLYTRVLRGHVEEGDDVGGGITAAGVLRITPAAFARQLTTFRATGRSAGDRLDALSRFGRLFIGDLWEVYGPRAVSAAGGRP